VTEASTRAGRSEAWSLLARDAASIAAMVGGPYRQVATLTDGTSETTIDISLSALQAGGYPINGHKSAKEANTYVFCGPIPGA
jgi:hypothetical protein